MTENIKKRIYEVIESPAENPLPNKIFNIFIMTLITLNVTSVIIETVNAIASVYSDYLHKFDIISVMIFSVEYLLRIWTCTIDEKYQKPVTGRLKFAASPMAIIDLIAILPFYLPMFIIDMRFVRVLRLFRLFRLFKLGRYSESLKKFGNVLKLKREELGIAVFIVTILLIFASSIMYHFEHEAQPEAFSSIPKAMWWSVATLTTVGYGDVYPVTNIGKLFGSIIAILGVGMVALPAGILASGFAEEIKHKENEKLVCPHCGKNIK